MVGQDIANVQVGVRFSMAAPKLVCPLHSPCGIRILYKTVDKYVSNVYKGHILKLSFRGHFVKNMLKNRDIFIKDTKINSYVSRETCFI